MRWPNTLVQNNSLKNTLPERRRWLWVLKGLIAFVPEAQRRRGGAGDDEDDVEELTTKYFELQKMFRQRLQKAQMRSWDGLLQKYLQELEKTQVNGEGILAADLSRLLPQAKEDEDAMKAAARNIGCGGFRAAKSLLEGRMAAPPTAATNEEIANLAAIGIDEAEREQTKLQCMSAGKATGKCRDPRVPLRRKYLQKCVVQM